jgi:hypothetical protein
MNSLVPPSIEEEISVKGNVNKSIYKSQHISEQSALLDIKTPKKKAVKVDNESKKQLKLSLDSKDIAIAVNDAKITHKPMKLINKDASEKEK